MTKRSPRQVPRCAACKILGQSPVPIRRLQCVPAEDGVHEAWERHDELRKTRGVFMPYSSWRITYECKHGHRWTEEHSENPLHEKSR